MGVSAVRVVMWSYAFMSQRSLFCETARVGFHAFAPESGESSEAAVSEAWRLALGFRGAVPRDPGRPRLRGRRAKSAAPRRTRRRGEP